MAPELGLDLKLSASEIITSFTKEASSTHDESQRISKLQEFIANLEDERRKIEVFKRELPLCMFLLNDVIAGIKDELEQCRSKKRHVLEEFMPIKSKLEEEEDGRVKLEKDCKDKMNWMSSAQLWSDNYSDDVKINYHKYCKTNTVSAHDDEESEAPSIESKSKRSAAVVAFKGISGISGDERTVTTVGLPGLSLVARAVSVLPADQRSGTSSAFKPIARSQVAAHADSHVSLSSSQQKQQQAAAAARKARRSWSPELHRRFVAALQQLGGAQVATPKQIRELMKVDGLTNDEVKSHLQKYRLHTKRIPNSSSSMNQHAVMVMGGLWVSPQQNYTKSQQSGSPQGPLQLAAAASSSRAISVTGGDSCDEDGKSESFSWK